MTALELMKSKLPYIQFNYGKEHPLTIAAQTGDVEAFRAAGAHITEMMDTTVVAIIDAK
ncbi:hypothetical protein [Herbaspirillum huttiense]|uniref:hypothetical protein n=1 Tax=Herbaspirillum huttiense TaxID=863372 RepID=UPI0039AE9768